MARLSSAQMNTPRFFCPPPLPKTGEIALPDEVNHHIRVRRLRAGDTVTLFDGSGGQWQATLAFDVSGRARAHVTHHCLVDRELKGQVHLIQGIASQDRMDWVVEKAVELGVTRLIPVASARSVVKLSQERAAKRTAHWQRLAYSAAEQCGRNRLMTVAAPTDLNQAVDMCGSEPMLLCHLSEPIHALDTPEQLEQIAHAGAVTVIVGPEGGWSPEEASQWLRAGAQPVSLGARTLRTETAGLVAIAQLTALLRW